MRIFRGKLWAIEERGALTFTSTARIRLRVPTSRRPGQDKLGTWSIENGYWTISFWPQVRGEVISGTLGTFIPWY